MTYSIIVSEEAIINIEDALNYYNTVANHVTKDFYKDLESTVESLERHALKYQIRYRDIRIAHLLKFPYGIHYLVNRNEVIILKILHHKQTYFTG